MPDHAAAPEDVIRRAREHAGYDDMPESLREPFLAVCDLADVLLAERQQLREALERIADTNDPLEGIGSEAAFARAALAAGDGSLLEVFLEQGDDDVSHEVEDYDPPDANAASVDGEGMPTEREWLEGLRGDLVNPSAYTLPSRTETLRLLDKLDRFREAALDALSCQHNPGLCSCCREALQEALDGS